MLSRVILASLHRQYCRTSRPNSSAKSASSTSSAQYSQEQDDTQLERQQWLRKFEMYLKSTSSELPKDWISTNFSRSSGPGGQNVNKLNTKAEVRLNLTIASKDHFDAPSMSKEIVNYLINKSPYYTASSHSILVTSMKTRSQAGNLQDALDKVKEHLVSILSQGIRGETSIEQQNKVKRLIAKDKAKTRQSKGKRGLVKSSRRTSKVSIDF